MNRLDRHTYYGLEWSVRKGVLFIRDDRLPPAPADILELDPRARWGMGPDTPRLPVEAYKDNLICKNW